MTIPKIDTVPMNPRLSVILPVYNGMPYLRDTVESILRQTCADFTFIIVNDGSTDDSGSYLRSLTDPRIVLIDQPNQGQAAARNTALRHCQSEYVALTDQDDISTPNRLATQLAFLDSHPQVVMAGTQIEFLIGDVRQKALPIPTGHHEIEARLLQGRAGICHASLMMRAQAARACGGYPSGMMGEDVDFCLRMCEQGTVANLDEVLFLYRLHAGQASQAKSRDIVRAIRFAAHRALRRRSGQTEPDFAEFLRQSSLLDRYRWSVEAWELTQYRSARILIASERRFLGFARLALLALCRPVAVMRRAMQTVWHLIAGYAQLANSK